MGGKYAGSGDVKIQTNNNTPSIHKGRYSARLGSSSDGCVRRWECQSSWQGEHYDQRDRLHLLVSTPWQSVGCGWMDSPSQSKQSRRAKMYTLKSSRFERGEVTKPFSLCCVKKKRKKRKLTARWKEWRQWHQRCATPPPPAADTPQQPSHTPHSSS